MELGKVGVGEEDDSAETKVGCWIIAGDDGGGSAGDGKLG